jgi:hypothetical protein
VGVGWPAVGGRLIFGGPAWRGGLITVRMC